MRCGFPTWVNRVAFIVVDVSILEISTLCLFVVYSWVDRINRCISIERGVRLAEWIRISS
jgi:hypothetical protein